MPYKMTGSTLHFTPELMGLEGVESFPSGATFSANTSDSNVATATCDSSGNVTLTRNGQVTGNVYVNLTATIPGQNDDVTGSLLVHVNPNADSAKWINLTPVS